MDGGMEDQEESGNMKRAVKLGLLLKVVQPSVQ